MESALSESSALSQKSEREYITLRDSIKGMTETWKTDTDRLREEMRKREERWKAEAEAIGKKYRLLVEEIKASKDGKVEVKQLRDEDAAAAKRVEDGWVGEIERMKEEVERKSKESDEAVETAKCVHLSCARVWILH